MNTLVAKIDKIIEERSLLKHPFYEMWSSGDLTQESLAGYSKEYFQLVKAVPSFMTPIIQQSPSNMVNELVSNQQEESEHIEPWMEFAHALGVPESELVEYPGLEKTNKAISEMSQLMNTFEGGACAMYAFEKEIPKISQIKLDGLEEFYGITKANATKYFKLHIEADIRHTASWKNVLEQSPYSQNLIEIADKSLYAQNLLLDGCYESYC